MNYGALSFIFDGIPSEAFGLFLCTVGEKGVKTYEGGSSVTIHTDKTPQMDFNYLMGVEHEEMFEFTMTFASNEPKDKFDISLINNWLIGHSEYKKLQIIQEDMLDVYYNCILNDYKIVTFGNYAYAFECTVICDRPWALTNSRIYKYASPTTIMHYNNSHSNRLIYPKLTFTTNNVDATVSIVNASNKNWETKFQGLSNGETIVIDNQLQLISSSLGLRRLQNFNKHWFELVPKQNKLIVTGNVKEIIIEYNEIRKVG